MATFNETELGKQYVNGEWLVEVIEIQPTKVITKVLRPAYKAGKLKSFVATDWVAYTLYSPKESQSDGNSRTFHQSQDKAQHFNLEIDENGNFVIRDSNGLEILATNIKGPQGSKGDTGPQGPQGFRGADGMSVEPRITDDGEKIYFVDGAGKIISNEFQLRGKPGADGKTFIPRMSKDGRSLYFINENGEKVSDEFLIKGEDGKQGPTGPTGKDGKLWIPEISEDRKKLRFVNGLDSTDATPWYEIQGAKGDTGDEGPRGVQGPVGPVFIPSVNADGDLSWSNNGGADLKNPPTRNIKGDKGDKGDNGATFHPVVKDGVLYWYDDNGHCVNSISPVRITGAQGKRGEQGQPGLSAYDIWLKQGNYGTEQDFLDSLKGEKGTPAPPANFSFKDVEDYTCKVQKINTNLIIDSEESSDSPEDIIRNRTEEIKNLREKGHDPENQRKNNVGWFKKFTWWCAGVDKDLLTMCPADHSKYVGVGTVILFTALMAWFSSFIAMRLVLGVADEGINNLGTLGAALFAVFWASMIFCLDRFITNTMYSDGRVTISKQEFICGLPRIIIAIFLGIVISAPLEIKIFEKEINNKIFNELMVKNRESIETEQRTEIKNIDDEIDSLEVKKIAILEKQAKIQHLKDAIDDEKKNRKDAISRVVIDKASVTVTRKPGESDEDYNKRKSKAISDANDDVNSDRTKQENKAAASFDEKIKKLNALITEYTADPTQYDKLISSKKKEKVKIDSIYSNKLSVADSVFMSQLGLGTQLAALHAIAMEDYTPFIGEKNTWIDYISLHPLWHYLFFSAIGLIMFLFILIDISPVLYKMMLADGNYDNYLHQEKLLAQDKIRLSLSNMLKKLNESELQRVAPFVMGDIYEKMAGDSYVYKTEDEFKKEMEQQKSVSKFWRIWPFSLLRWLFYKEKGYPSAPVIIMEPKIPSDYQQAIQETNEAVFAEVLDMKKKIILAAYRRWYKTQHDCIICDDVDDENKAREPFEDDISENDDFTIAEDDFRSTNDESKEDSYNEEDSQYSDENEEDDDESENEESTTENSDSSTQESTDSDSANEEDDEQESPDDDGDDIPNNDKK